jgi:hypothetical protein
MPSRQPLIVIAVLAVCAAAAQNFLGGFTGGLDGPHAVCHREVAGYDGLRSEVSSWPPGIRCASHKYATNNPVDTVSEVVPPTAGEWTWLVVSSLVIASFVYGLAALTRRLVRWGRARAMA